MYNYEGVANRLPPAAVSKPYPADPAHPHTFYRWSAFVSLLPYMDQGNLAAMFDLSLPMYMPGPGNPISEANRAAVSQSVPNLLCPSDSGPRVLPQFGPTNYVVCAGSGAGGGTPFNCDGIFYTNSRTKFSSINRGVTHTVAMSESLLGEDTDFSPSAGFTSFRPQQNYKFVLTFTSSPALTDAQCANAKSYNSITSNGNNPRGFAWASGEYRCATYNHYYAPNAANCDCITSVTVDPSVPPAKPYLYSAYAWRTARSQHPTGVNVLMADGSARFVDNSVDLAVWQGCAKRDNDGPLVDLP